jgi:hypothetical protein
MNNTLTGNLLGARFTCLRGVGSNGAENGYNRVKIWWKLIIYYTY